MSPQAVGTSLAAALLLLGAQGLPGQQVSVGTSSTNWQSGFYEHFNVGWGFSRRSPNGSIFFNFNSPALPPFGGYDPNADFRFGSAQRWGNGRLSFNFTAGTGRRTTMTMSAPSVTMMNGVPGSVRDVSVRPFVVGLVPTVGDSFMMLPMMPTFSGTPIMATSPLAERVQRLEYERSKPQAASAPSSPSLVLEEESAVPETGPASSGRASSAERGDLSVSEIRRAQAAEELAKQQEVKELIDAARQAEKAGQKGIARVRYQQAAAKVTGKQRNDLLAAAARLKNDE